MSTFTPGPWFVADWSKDFGDELFTIETRTKEVLLPGQSSIWPEGVRKIQVATTEEGGFDRETSLANARLIAAAPDLLEALKAQAELSRIGLFNADEDFIEQVTAKRRAAIAKAEGGEA